MLGQSKTAQQAEIDSPCELVDFWRFNVHYARQILAEQPLANSPGVWNRLDHRPLEGFVYAITPFNFTAIAGNLPTAPALMGNVVVWKPSPTQTHAAVLLMRLLEEAGLPNGVINLVTGDGIDVSEVALDHPDLAGIHFTGSTKTFQYLWKTVGDNIEKYRSYPRIVGETGGKDFVVAHPSADPAVLKTALTRGCLRVPGPEVLGHLPRLHPALASGTAASRRSSPPRSTASLHGRRHRPVQLHRRRHRRARLRQEQGRDRPRQADPTVEIVAGGTYDDSVGYFVRPTVLVCTDPANEVFHHRVLRPDPRACTSTRTPSTTTMLDQVDRSRPYALTGSVIAGDRAAAAQATGRCATRPATSTSTTSPPAPSSASSPSAAAGPPAPTTRRAPRRT